MSDAKKNIATPITIEKVAALAGVSIKTVSRVVNREPNVRETTRELVQAVIDRVGYRPNASARRLAGQRSFLIALVYEDPSRYVSATANYVTNLQGGVLKKTREAGYDLLLQPCNYQNPDVVNELRVLVEHSRVDGLLLAPPLAEVRAIVDMLRGLDKPVIRISPGEVRGTDAVNTNDREVSAEMTCYLASLGHRRIAFIQGHPHHRAMSSRELGYRDGLAQCAMPYRTSLVLQGDNSFESGVACAERLLRRKNPPTAIFAGNDDMAVGVLQVAQKLGLSVPHDLSVAGFDNVPLARQVWPPLTTIDQPTFSLGEKATELLFKQIAGSPPPARAYIKSTLVIRQSTAAPQS